MRFIKYVMVHDCFPIIFDGFNHSDMKNLEKEITSAALFYFDDDGKVQTYGESLTLKMGPNKDDAAIIQKLFDMAKE